MKLEPSASDESAMAVFAASIERAIVAAYDVGATHLTGSALATLQAFAAHHRDHAGVLDARAGSKVGTAVNPRLMAGLVPQFAGAADQPSVLKLAFQLENQLASTFQYLSGKFSTAAGLRVVASILPVECQHAVVLGGLLRLDLEKDLAPFTVQGVDAAPTHLEWAFFDPARYPAAG